MKWTIDRLEENYAILENNLTKELKEVPRTALPDEIHDGTLLIQINNTYTLDLTEEERLRQEILEKFQKLRSKN